MKKQRMGDNPLDMLVTSSGSEESPAPRAKARAKKAAPLATSKRRATTKPRTETTSSKDDPPRATAKAHATFHLPVELVEDARDAVSALAGPPLHLTLAELVVRAIRAELGRLGKQHNGGAPFPKRRAPIRSGRPIS